MASNRRKGKPDKGDEMLAAVEGMGEVGSVSVKVPPEMCDSCRCRLTRHEIRVVQNSKAVDDGLNKIPEGVHTVLKSLAWTCSTCAMKKSRCRVCGDLLAGMPEYPWFIDDKGSDPADNHLLTCNPYHDDVPQGEKVSCSNPKCSAYSEGMFSRFQERRRHAHKTQRFPDTYVGFLADPPEAPGTPVPRGKASKGSKAVNQPKPKDDALLEEMLKEVDKTQFPDEASREQARKAIRDGFAAEE